MTPELLVEANRLDAHIKKGEEIVNGLLRHSGANMNAKDLNMVMPNLKDLFIDRVAELKEQFKNLGKEEIPKIDIRNAQYKQPVN